VIDYVTIYTDGACRGNPGVGGWGASLEYKGNTKEIFGGEPLTTNNRMELMAVIKALQALTRRCPIKVHTDSAYVLNGITTWIESWKKSGWKTSTKKPVKNVDLWQELDRLNQYYHVEYVKVKGHSGNKGNDRADVLANKGADSISV
jgi:ribonuclease HI